MSDGYIDPKRLREAQREQSIRAAMSGAGDRPVPEPGTLGSFAEQVHRMSSQVRESIEALCLRLVGPMVHPKENMHAPVGNPNEELSLSLKLSDALRRLHAANQMLEELHKEVQRG